MITVLIEIKGGNIIRTTSTQEFEFFLLDHDVPPAESGNNPLDKWSCDAVETEQEMIDRINLIKSSEKW